MSANCKIAEEKDYDNCGPNVEGNYCLFHKPLQGNLIKDLDVREVVK